MCSGPCRARAGKGRDTTWCMQGGRTLEDLSSHPPRQPERSYHGKQTTTPSDLKSPSGFPCCAQQNPNSFLWSTRPAGLAPMTSFSSTQFLLFRLPSCSPSMPPGLCTYCPLCLECHSTNFVHANSSSSEPQLHCALLRVPSLATSPVSMVPSYCLSNPSLSDCLSFIALPLTCSCPVYLLSVP